MTSTSTWGCGCVSTHSPSDWPPTAWTAWSTSRPGSACCRSTSIPTGCRAAAASDRALARSRAARDARARGAQPHRAPAAVVERPTTPRRGRRRVASWRRARRRAVVSVEHRVHPPRQRPGLRGAPDRLRRRILVLGLGGVYLGAPVAAPLDPRRVQREADGIAALRARQSPGDARGDEDEDAGRRAAGWLDGVVAQVLVQAGDEVVSGSALLVLR